MVAQPARNPAAAQPCPVAASMGSLKPTFQAQKDIHAVDSPFPGRPCCCRPVLIAFQYSKSLSSVITWSAADHPYWLAHAPGWRLVFLRSSSWPPNPDGAAMGKSSARVIARSCCRRLVALMVVVRFTRPRFSGWAALGDPSNLFVFRIAVASFLAYAVANCLEYPGWLIAACNCPNGWIAPSRLRRCW